MNRLSGHSLRLLGRPRQTLRPRAAGRRRVGEDGLDLVGVVGGVGQAARQLRLRPPQGPLRRSTLRAGEIVELHVVDIEVRVHAVSVVLVKAAERLNRRAVVQHLQADRARGAVDIASGGHLGRLPRRARARVAPVEVATREAETPLEPAEDR